MTTMTDPLATIGPELSDDELDLTNGGLLPLIIVLVGFDVGLWGYIALR